jgi:hypothetical protein
VDCFQLHNLSAFFFTNFPAQAEIAIAGVFPRELFFFSLTRTKAGCTALFFFAQVAVVRQNGLRILRATSAVELAPPDRPSHH